MQKGEPFKSTNLVIEKKKIMPSNKASDKTPGHRKLDSNYNVGDTASIPSGQQCAGT